MKLKTADLERIISRMVREELDRLLPKMVAEHLSREYIRGIVSESAPAPRAPAPRRQAPESRKIVSELVQRHSVLPKSELLSEDNPYRELYEGVTPIDLDPPPDDVDIDRLDFNIPIDAMERIAGIE